MRGVALVVALTVAKAAAAPVVGPGTYRPVYPPTPGETEIPVPAFRLDRTPVTNEAYLAFVEAHPEWKRGDVPPVFADGAYLGKWASPDVLGGAVDPRGPVTQVSWFAAKAYCKAQGGRLPTEAEWELAAAADERRADARRDPAFVQRILAWYAQRTPAKLPPVGQGEPNAWGISDLHGLVWEWVLDFNGELVASDNRDQGDPDRTSFCGAGALDATDVSDYASFLRIAYRASLQASYTTNNLGFRCAYDLEES